MWGVVAFLQPTFAVSPSFPTDYICWKSVMARQVVIAASAPSLMRAEVVRRDDRDGGDVERACGAEDAQRDLAPVGDEQLLHGADVIRPRAGRSHSWWRDSWVPGSR